MERGGAESQIFAPLPEESEEMADVKLSDIGGMPPATVAVLEEAGYRTLNDILDLEREDFLKLPGIAPEEADRIMTMIDELTTEDAGGDESQTGGSEGGSAA
jgi:N utilization substance protein A